MSPIINFASILFLCHVSLAREQCFFDSSTICSEYCCAGSGFHEYCCSDCGKSRGLSCPIVANIGYIVGGVFGGLVLLFIIGVIITMCVMGCICANVTGRQPYSSRSRVTQQPQRNVVAYPGANPVNPEMTAHDPWKQQPQTPYPSAEMTMAAYPPPYPPSYPPYDASGGMSYGGHAGSSPGEVGNGGGN